MFSRDSVKMRYQRHDTVRWHDTGADRTVTPSRVLELMQETASAHCRAIGHDLDVMRDEKGLGFVVTRFSAELLQPILAHDAITIDTWVPECTGLFFGRCYEIRRDRDGCVLARGVSTSVLLDLATRKFLRVTDYDFGFQPEEAVVLSESIPTRLRIPKELVLEAVGTRTVVRSDLDYNLHMNNTHYPDMLADFLPDGGLGLCIRSAVISYLGEARMGDTLTVTRGSIEEDGGVTQFFFRITRADGTVVTEARMETAREAPPCTDAHGC